MRLRKKHNIAATEYSGISEFGVRETYRGVYIIGYTIPHEWVKRKSYPFIEIDYTGLSLTFYYGHRLEIDTIPRICCLIIDGIDEI